MPAAIRGPSGSFHMWLCPSVLCEEAAVLVEGSFNVALTVKLHVVAMPHSAARAHRFKGTRLTLTTAATRVLCGLSKTATATPCSSVRNRSLGNNLVHSNDRDCSSFGLNICIYLFRSCVDRIRGFQCFQQVSVGLCLFDFSDSLVVNIHSNIHSTTYTAFVSSVHEDRAER